MPFASASACFRKLPPTPDSLTVVKFSEPKTLQQEAAREKGREPLSDDSHHVILLEGCSHLQQIVQKTLLSNLMSSLVRKLRSP